MNNPDTYPNPDSFEPIRFIPKDDTKDQQRRFTEVFETFPVWEYGSLACPDRHHASLAIKMILSHLLLKWA
ncbi:ent-kaurene oxidase [Diaporthe helianthi]|uniref:Ent-kaurene oxidase n=1 Tax=Diaporthe helianthi TaxID=158607 RepID=A0A2P5HXX2_DIAHE|nr:ent-kaurene oxidase [Diaporthe helianthi]